MKKRIAVIDEQLARVVRIIQDLLSSTRPRKPEPQWCVVEEVVNPAVALMEPAFHAKEVTLAVSIAADLPLVWADQEKIHQALVNILANTLAATPPGGAVTISTTARDATAAEQEYGARVVDLVPPLMLAIMVQDTGCGIPKADVEKVFEPLFTTKAAGKGTGLGLFLSRETVVAHGGSLSLVSEVGCGTTVTMTLPAKRPDSAHSMEGA